MIKLKWITCGKDRHWCSLEDLDLDTASGDGVYIIWHGGDPSRTVRVGQGNIADRLGAHGNDQDILDYRENGTLRVTWAIVPAYQRDGIERYLADMWKPLIGEAFPDAVPIAVKSPW